MSKDKDKKGSKAKKKKYAKPKVTRHGSLQGIAERVTGTTTLCCLTERARTALRSAPERRRLLRDVGRSLTAR
jgi:hypothetical protein